MHRSASKTTRGTARHRSTPSSASKSSSAPPKSLKITLPARNPTQTTTGNLPTESLDSEPEGIPAGPTSPQTALLDHPESIPALPEIQPATECDEDIVITPVTPPPSPGKPCSENVPKQQPSSTCLDGSTSGSDIDVAPTQKPRKLKGIMEISKEVPTLQEIILFIPQVSSDSKKRKKVAGSITYNEALDIIYETIGCQEVVRKPELQYKLSDASQKDSAIGLGNEEDWIGLCEEVLRKQEKRKAVTVGIIVGDQYMYSLRSQANEGKKTSHTSVSSQKRKIGKKMMVMDLNNDGDEEDEGDEGLLEKEKKFYKQLRAALSKCQLCGDTKFCKIARNGEHINLSFQQQRGWVIALAHGTHGVTLMTPPKGDLFQQFHGPGTPKEIPSAPPATPAASGLAYPSVQMTPGPMHPYMMPPWFMSPMGAFVGNSNYPASPIAWQDQSNKRKHDPMPSSDPPDDPFEEPYPEIETFIHRLSIQNSKRNLDKHIAAFEAEDYYNINDLVEFTLDRLTNTPFELSMGNAEFLIKEVRKEVNRIDKIRAKNRERARHL